MKNFFKDSQFSFQTLRLLGEAAWGAADIEEVLTTVDRIKDGDFESWCLEWANAAEACSLHLNLRRTYPGAYQCLSPS